MDIEGVCHDTGRVYGGGFVTRRVFDPGRCAGSSPASSYRLTRQMSNRQLVKSFTKRFRGNVNLTLFDFGGAALPSIGIFQNPAGVCQRNAAGSVPHALLPGNVIYDVPARGTHRRQSPGDRNGVSCRV